MKSQTIRVTLLSATLTLFGALSTPSWAASEKLPTLTPKDVKALIARAKTPAEHRRIARYFNHEAEKYEADGKDHEDMIEAYRQNPMPKNLQGPGTISHCEILVSSNREMAKTARELAAAHEQMTKEAAK
jgi:hypothetical protein